MSNPFKYGTVVEDGYFTDRVHDLAKSIQIIQSANHLILISPRRYGKTSLINKMVAQLKRPTISLNLQMVSSTTDLATQLLKRVLALYPMEKLKYFLRNFRVAPTISFNPVTNATDVSFPPIPATTKPMLEDVLTLIESLGKKGKKPLVVLDEFQEIRSIDKALDKQLRSIIQLHQRVSYVFMGSQESLMREIFERKKSPFYHFGTLQNLDVIPYADFEAFLKKGFAPLHKNAASIAKEILQLTKQHPYYTQMLAFHYVNALQRSRRTTLQEVLEAVVREHDIDYERLWMGLNLKDRELMLELIYLERQLRYSKNSNIPTSTRYSAYKRLLKSGFLIQGKEGYRVEDPFFAAWIVEKREGK